MAAEKQPNKNALDFLNEDQSAQLGGFEQMTADTMVMPFLRVAQKMTSALEPADESHIPGLKVGDFYDTATRTVYGQSVDIVVLGMSHVYFEYAPSDVPGQPDKSRPLATHKHAEIARRQDIDRTNFKLYVTPEGNFLQEHYVYYVIVPGYENEGVKIFSVYSSGLRAAKKMNTHMAVQKLPNGKKPKQWHMIYTLSNVPKQDGKNTWQELQINFKDWITPAILEAAAGERTSGLPLVENGGQALIGYSEDEAPKVIEADAEPVAETGPDGQGKLPF